MRTKGMVRTGVLVLILLLLTDTYAIAGGSEGSRKTCILLVAFGTSFPQARGAFENIQQEVKKTFPETPVRWAYTSAVIRKKLARQGEILDSPETALARMMDDGFTRLAVQSLHTIPGEEFHDLCETASAFSEMPGGLDIEVGLPLLASDGDIDRAVEAIFDIIPEERTNADAVVLMGHGTPHPSNALYAALMYRLQLRDPRIFVGCVEGFPRIAFLKARLMDEKIGKAFLMPFMSVAGDHARNDLAGEDKDSWKSILTRAGITCIPVLEGTAEYDVFVDIWVDHLKQTMGRLH
mgnify:CR=1 FL=1